MRFVFVLSLAVFGTAARASSSIDTALQSVRDAQDANDGGGGCGRGLSKRLKASASALKDAREEPSKKAIRRAREAIDDASEFAKDECSGKVRRRVREELAQATAALDDDAHVKETEEHDEKTTSSTGLASLGSTVGGFLSGFRPGETTTRSAHTSKTRTEESMHVNGHPVDPADDDAPAPAPAPANDKQPFRGYCKTNPDCQSSVCYVGYGNPQGYCSKMCDGFSDCPSFWKCQRVGNAPQKICIQPKE
jgi:hypothetical protein